MAKRYSFIAILLCLSCFKATAQDVVVKDVEGPTYVVQGDLHDLLYAETSVVGPYKSKRFAAPDEAVVNYKDRITNMPQYLHDFIAEFVKAGQEVLAGGSNWLSDPKLGLSSSSGYYYLLNEVKGTADFTFAPGSDAATIQQAAIDAFKGRYEEEYDIMKSFLPFAFLSLNLDHPEFFWIGNGFQYSCGNGCSYSYYTNGRGTVNYTITLKFNLLTSNFDIRNNGVSTYNFRNTTNLANGVQKFKNCVQTILSECQTGSRYDKLLAAHDWLTLHNCYNYYYLKGYAQSLIGDTPWSSFSAIEGHNDQQAPVCEGYARAFKVLCDKMGIPCILMSGNVVDEDGNRGGHMWNYVQMENGKWYAVDVTWDDPTVWSSYDQFVTGFESHDWFLLGSSTDVGGGLTFIESHPEQWYDNYPSGGSYSWDLQAGPELSPIAWTPDDEKTGDVNKDGDIDIADAVSVLNAMAGESVAGNADVNADGQIDIADFVSVLNIMAGL